jgi:L-ascorbate metabolism protein UlaG (beta-lactamase superfamily)
MKITKYGHACLILEEQGQRLIIDPGEFTPDLGDYNNTVGVVITHVHADHFDPNNISKILATNPDIQIWSTAQVAEQLNTPTVTAVSGGSTASIGPFHLRFFGGQHATIHPDYPADQNVGVAVGNFYYPGDSFSMPKDTSVKTLAVPASAPWLKIAEAMDFIRNVKPTQCFPTHDALLSDVGHATVNNWLGRMCETEGVGFTYLQPGQSLET